MCGLGELPDAPVVGYLARSLSAFYAAFAVMTLYIARDVRRFKDLVKLWGILFFALGAIILGIDLSIDLPMFWRLLEGPPTIAIGLLVLWLQRSLGIQQS